MKWPISALFILSAGFAQQSQAQQWAPRPASLQTRWYKSVTPENAWKSYPRPQMIRNKWLSLNGLWSYCITDSSARSPQPFDSSILVPYPIESPLSGVKKALLPNQQLWYRRTFRISRSKQERVLLHFGAVDYQATIILNGKRAGFHQGGYESFSIDITELLQKEDNELVISVWDPTDQGNQPVGKQTLRPRTSFFTASSGIWQSVWLEWVPDQYIAELKLVPDIDRQQISLSIITSQKILGGEFQVEARSKGEIVARKKVPSSEISLPIPEPLLWTPDHPFLYALRVKLIRQGRVIDSVDSYFGMRKIEVQKDSTGIDRIFLNHQYLFNLGVLDQGFWPDGAYTAPGDSGFLFDIQTVKFMGFNTIRKHLKIEPERWYYDCDSIGMLVWQDMPCRYPGIKVERDDAGSRNEFIRETKSMIHQLANHPSIVVWVPFNEDWASFDTASIRALVRQLDPTRLINTNSGSKKYDGPSGDFSVVHHYCYPSLPPRRPGKPMVLGEYGGVNVIVEGHQWKPGFTWGHGEIQDNGIDFMNLYEDWVSRLAAFEREGLSAAIFTQPYDCEHEACGLMTFDREVFKIPINRIREIHDKFWGKVKKQ